MPAPIGSGRHLVGPVAAVVSAAPLTGDFGIVDLLGSVGDHRSAIEGSGSDPSIGPHGVPLATQRSTSPITGSSEAMEATVSAIRESAIMTGRAWRL